MATLQTQSPKRASGEKASDGRLFVLDASGGRIFTANTDGSELQTIVTGCRMPDGIVVDVGGGHIYWTNMGNPKKNDGSIESVDLNGRNRKAIVPEGGTFTPKQLHVEEASGKLYWCDREGMRVMRCNPTAHMSRRWLTPAAATLGPAPTPRSSASASPSTSKGTANKREPGAVMAVAHD